MSTLEKMRKAWDFVKPPAVEEDETDAGSALYAPALHLLGVRLVLAIILTVLTFTTWLSFGFPHIFSILFPIEAVTFFALAASSLFVAFDFPVNICGTLIEALYFTSGALSIAATVVKADAFLPLLIIQFAHLSMAPKIRIRPWFIVLPLLCHIPYVISELLTSPYVDVGGLILEMLGLAVAGVVAYVLTEIMKYAESKHGMNLGVSSRSSLYSAI